MVRLEVFIGVDLTVEVPALQAFVSEIGVTRINEK